MTIKVTLEMLQERRSWTEAHYAITAESFGDAALPAQNLAVLRDSCLGNRAVVTAVRLSEVPANRQTQDEEFTLPNVPWPTDPTNTLWDSAFGNVALLYRLTGTVGAQFNAPAPPKNLYLAGLPISTFVVGASGGRDYILPGQLNTAVRAYLNFLAFVGQSFWGYRTRNPGTPTQAQGLVTNALTPVQIGVVAPTIPGVAAGSQVYLTGWRRQNTRTPNLQGAYLVGSVTTVAGPPSVSTYYLWGSGRVDPNNYERPGFIAPLTYQFAAYQTWTPVKTVTRKRGGSLGAPRGRSRIRA